jgi:hypothetical protein
MTRRVRFSPLLATGCFWCAATLAQAGQVPFEPRPPIGSPPFGGPFLVAAADLDGDGDTDVVSAATFGGEVVAHLNSGNGSTWTPHTVATMPFGAIALAVADIDGDGDLDALSSSGAGGVVTWFNNTAGNGTAWTSNPVGTSLYNGSFISAGDVDRDGDQDVVTASGINNLVLWFENAGGTGGAWVRHTVSSSAGAAPRSAKLADLDGDGDPDVIVATAGATGLWFENTAGNGSAWIPRTLGLAQGEDETTAADVDGDGDLDVLVPMTSAGALGWHENVAGNATVWARRTISTSVLNARSVAAVDVDGDGDIDALAAAGQTENAVAWYENVAGNGASWTKRTIATGLVEARSAVTADVDGDGDLDAVSGSQNNIAWHRNATLHGNACFVNRVISTAVDGSQSAVASDVDGDGDLDAVSTAFLGDTVAWHENVAGNATGWTTRTITTAFDQAARAVAADVDRDGDVDVAAVQGNFASGALTWFDNTAGNGGAWTPRTVSTSLSTASHVEAADVSGDGDLDLLASGYYTAGVRWFENAAGNGSAWTPGTVPASGGQTGAVTTDIDGDGDLDVASTESFFGDGLGWQENTAGNGSAWTAHTISTILGSTDALAAADVDRDGDVDVVQPGTNFVVGNTIWYENVGGAGASWAPHTIPGGEGSTVAAGDLDRDGDVDVVTPGGGAGIRWHENANGTGTAWTSRTVSEAVGVPGGLGIADLDGDGDPDLLSAFVSSDTVSWHENQGGQASMAVASQAPPTANNSEVVSMLRATVTHLGRVGDGPLELASLGLRLEESPGDPLTTAEANALIESLRVYRDANGNGVFEPASDVLVTSIGTLSLAAGVQGVPFTDGDVNVQVTAGTPRAFFVVVELTGNASTQVPNQFLVTLLQVGPSASVLEDRTFDIPLRLACPADVSSTIKQAVPVELIGFTIE